MRVSVVILNWNTSGYLERWLPGLLASLGPDDEAVVADNGSTDGSLEMLARKFPSVRTVAFDRNLGFTGGYNAALKQVDAEYCVLANSDVEFHSGWLEPLVEWMETHRQCAVCGPKLHSFQSSSEGPLFEYAGAAGGLLDRFGFPFCRGRVAGRIDSDRGQYDDMTDEVLWVSGACMMVRTDVWNALGGLDERFFAHMEEIDFCWRARLAGYGVSVVSTVAVKHLGGGTLPQTSPLKLKLNFRNNLLLLDKNLPMTVGRRKASVIIFLRKCIDAAAFVAYLLSFRPASAAAVFRAHREYSSMRNHSEEGACRDVSGYLPLCIIPLSFFKGESVFSYLKRYENNH